MRIIALWFGLLISVFSLSPLLAQELVDKVQESFPGIETVSIKGSFCKTEITVGSDADLTLEGEIRSVRRYQDLRIRYAQTGSQLDVWIEHPRNTSGQIRGFLLLSVPAHTRVVVSNLSGSVIVDGVGNSTTTIETLSGDVVLKNITDAVDVRTASGNINGTLIEGEVYAHSVSGNIAMKDIQGACHLVSISGNIKVSSAFNGVELTVTSGNSLLSDVIGHAGIRSVSGEIVVSRLKGKMVASSSSGGIRVEEVVGQLDLTSTSGSIRGQQVLLTDHSAFKNASGDIDITFSNDAEALSFELKTSSGRIDVYGLSADKQFKKGDGSLIVTGVTTSGDQSYK